MKKKLYNIMLSGLVVLLAAVSCTKGTIEVSDGRQSIAQTDEEKAYLAGQVVVKFDESLTDLLDKSGLSATPASRSGISTVDELMDIVGGYRLERVFPETTATEERTREAGLHLWYVVYFSEDEDVNEVVEKLSVLGDVRVASPVLRIKRLYDGKVIPFNRPSTVYTKSAADEQMFNDEYLAWQWGLVNNGAADYKINPDFADEENYPDGYPFDKQASEKFVAGYDIKVEGAWELCTGDPSIIVAVLDEGIYLTHPDLAANIWTNEGEIYGSLVDNDGNGYAGDAHGYDFVNDRGVITWDSYGDTGHGSHVSGVIAAVNDNGIGVSSIAGGTASSPGVKLMSCQVFSGNLSSSTVALARAMKYAADNGAVVLQCSFGYSSGTANEYEYGQGYATEDEWTASSPLEKSALDYFIHNAGSDNGPVKGGIAVFASGNEYAPSAGFPGAYDSCISVAAVAGDYTPATYTNYGTGVNISAPGGDQDYYFDFLEDEDDDRGAAGCILSTVPEHVSSSGYGYMEGTSMACPHVSGVVALGISYAAQLHKHFTADEIISLLEESCTSINDLMTGKKFYYKYQTDASTLIHARTMDLSSYKGNMGAGVVNAAGLLALIAGDSGVQMQFPNIYVQLNSTTTASPSAFLDGDSFTISIDDPSVAEVGTGGASGTHSSEATGSGEFTFFGLGSGSTTGTITPSSGQPQTFVITVRSSDSGSGWL